MPARQSILLLVFCLLITIPAGIARADNDIDIQSPNSRVRVDDDGNIKINSNTQTGSISPLIVPTSRLPLNRRLRQLRSSRSPQDSQYSQCNGRTYTHQSSHNYGTALNHTYTSTTTTSCQ